jgi:hypothetical protein
MISYFVFYLTNLNILQATNNMKIKNNETNKYKYRKKKTVFDEVNHKKCFTILTGLLITLKTIYFWNIVLSHHKRLNFVILKILTPEEISFFRVSRLQKRNEPNKIVGKRLFLNPLMRKDIAQHDESFLSALIRASFQCTLDK